MAVNLGDAEVNISANTGELNRALKGVDSAMEQSLGASARRIGVAFTAMGGAILGSLGVAAKGSMDFKSALSEIRTLGVKDLETIEAGIKDVAIAYGKDLTETAKGAYQAISATGYDGAEAIKVLEVSTKAAAAGASSVSEAVELGTGVMNAYGKEVGDLEGIFGQAFVAVADGVTKFDQLAASLGKVAPIMAAAGLETDEMFASVTALTKGGIATSEAVSGLKAAMANIIKPSADAVKAAEELGIQFDTTALKTRGLEGFLHGVKQATGGNIDTLAKFFPSVEGLNAILALTGNQAEAFSATLAKMKDSQNVLSDAFAKFAQDNPQLAFDQLTASLAVMGVEIGNAVLPLVVGFIGWMKPLVIGLTDWMRNNTEVTKAVVGLTAAIGAVLVVLGPLLIAWKEISMLFGAVQVVTAALSGGAGIGGLAVALGGPLGLAAVVLATATAIGVLLYHLGLWKQATEQLTESQNRLAAQQDKASEQANDHITEIKALGIAVDESAYQQMEAIQKLDYVNQLMRDHDLEIGEDRVVRARQTTEAVVSISADAATTMQGISEDIRGSQLKAWDLSQPGSPSVLDLAGGSLDAMIGMFQNAASAIGGILASIRDWAASVFDGIFGSMGSLSLPSVPAFAAGGVTRSPLAWVGEEGPELVALPVGSRVHSAQESARMAGGGVNLTVNFSGATIRGDRDVSDISRALAREVGNQLRIAGVYS